jgi:hypothetical protein
MQVTGSYQQSYKTFFTVVIYEWSKVCLPLAGLPSLIKCLKVRPEPTGVRYPPPPFTVGSWPYPQTLD